VSTTTAAFYLLAAFTAASALGVALTHNIVYSAFALMGSLLGTAGIFVLLGADFLGVVQLLVYVGGILVLSLFAIMLTHRIADVQVSNRSVGRLAATVVVGMVFVGLVRTGMQAAWVVGNLAAPQPGTYGVGNAFLTDFILPFEIASLVLLVALIGAVTVSRKELKG
jgi:NAD(P)H-quinone oxidoreductase subunit 6